MNGSEILSFTTGSIPQHVLETLEKHQLSLDDINLFIFHQANQFILERLRKKINIPAEKFYIYIENCGNTVSATIPIALKEAIREKKAAGKVLLSGFGVGYSWGSCIINLT